LARKNRRLGEHIFIVIFLCAQLVLNCIAKSMMFMHTPNALVYKINCVVSFIILSIYFSLKHLGSFQTRGARITFIAIELIILAALAMLISSETNALFNNHSFGLLALAISAYAIVFYYLKLTNPVIEHITATRSFWFISGLFIYYGGNFFIFSTYTVFIQSMGNKQFPVLWSIHNVIFLIMGIFFSKGFLCRPYQKT